MRESSFCYSIFSGNRSLDSFFVRFKKILDIELPNWITNIFRPSYKEFSKRLLFLQETISEHLLYAIFKARKWG